MLSGKDSNPQTATSYQMKDDYMISKHAEPSPSMLDELDDLPF